MQKYIFTEEEKTKVKEAVKELEKKSCGEIVPVFARKSDDYREASLYLALIMAAISLGVLALLSYTWMLPELSYIEASFLIFTVAAIGYFLPFIFPLLKRILTSKARTLEMVALKAKEAFVNEKVYETKEHVGILIFISRLEHLVIVLGDEGINEKVDPKDWEDVVSLIIDGLKKNEIGNGLVNGIHKCTELLLDHGFVRKESDTNELSDDLRIEDQ